MGYGVRKVYPCKNVTMAGIERHTFPASVLPRDIGKIMRGLRQAQGWSAATLAYRAGIARETVLRVESGRRPPRAETVLRLLEVLLAEQNISDLQEIVPSWPEADGRQVVGHGARSRARRRQLDLSAAGVAAKAVVREATLSRFERNAGPTPSLLKETRTEHGDLVTVDEQGAGESPPLCQLGRSRGVL